MSVTINQYNGLFVTAISGSNLEFGVSYKVYATLKSDFAPNELAVDSALAEGGGYVLLRENVQFADNETEVFLYDDRSGELNTVTSFTALKYTIVITDNENKVKSSVKKSVSGLITIEPTISFSGEFDIDNGLEFTISDCREEKTAIRYGFKVYSVRGLAPSQQPEDGSFFYDLSGTNPHNNGLSFGDENTYVQCVRTINPINVTEDITDYIPSALIDSKAKSYIATIYITANTDDNDNALTPEYIFSTQMNAIVPSVMPIDPSIESTSYFVVDESALIAGSQNSSAVLQLEKLQCRPPAPNETIYLSNIFIQSDQDLLSDGDAKNKLNEIFDSADIGVTDYCISAMTKISDHNLQKEYTKYYPSLSGTIHLSFDTQGINTITGLTFKTPTIVYGDSLDVNDFVENTNDGEDVMRLCEFWYSTDNGITYSNDFTTLKIDRVGDVSVLIKVKQTGCTDIIQSVPVHCNPKQLYFTGDSSIFTSDKINPIGQNSTGDDLVVPVTFTSQELATLFDGILDDDLNKVVVTISAVYDEEAAAEDGDGKPVSIVFGVANINGSNKSDCYIAPETDESLTNLEIGSVTIVKVVLHIVGDVGIEPLPYAVYEFEPDQIYAEERVGEEGNYEYIDKIVGVDVDNIILAKSASSEESGVIPGHPNIQLRATAKYFISGRSNRNDGQLRKAGTGKRVEITYWLDGIDEEHDDTNRYALANSNEDGKVIVVASVGEVSKAVLYIEAGAIKRPTVMQYSQNWQTTPVDFVNDPRAYISGIVEEYDLARFYEITTDENNNEVFGGIKRNSSTNTNVIVATANFDSSGFTTDTIQEDVNVIVTFTLDTALAENYVIDTNTYDDERTATITTLGDVIAFDPYVLTAASIVSALNIAAKQGQSITYGQTGADLIKDFNCDQNKTGALLLDIFKNGGTSIFPDDQFPNAMLHATITYPSNIYANELDSDGTYYYPLTIGGPDSDIVLGLLDMDTDRPGDADKYVLPSSTAFDGLVVKGRVAAVQLNCDSSKLTWGNNKTITNGQQDVPVVFESDAISGIIDGDVLSFDENDANADVTITAKAHYTTNTNTGDNPVTSYVEIRFTISGPKASAYKINNITSGMTGTVTATPIVWYTGIIPKAYIDQVRTWHTDPYAANINDLPITSNDGKDLQTIINDLEGKIRFEGNHVNGDALIFGYDTVVTGELDGDGNYVDCENYHDWYKALCRTGVNPEKIEDYYETYEGYPFILTNQDITNFEVKNANNDPMSFSRSIATIIIDGITLHGILRTSVNGSEFVGMKLSIN